jgi:hypothetical protein
MTKQTWKQLGIVSILMMGALTFFSMTNLALAQSNALAPTGGSPFTTSNDDIVGTGQGDLRTFVVNILRWVMTFLGLFCTIMIIYGGFLYITAAGEEEKAKKGRTIILYCVIGLAIIAVSFLIVKTVSEGLVSASQ